MAKRGNRESPALAAFNTGAQLVGRHPLFSGLLGRARLMRHAEHNPCHGDAWLRVEQSGVVWVHPTRLADAAEWACLIAHGLLYLGFGYFQRDRAYWPEWNAACDVVIARFLRDMKFGVPPDDRRIDASLPAWDEERWYRSFCDDGIDARLTDLGPGGKGQTGMLVPEDDEVRPDQVGPRRTPTWQQTFSEGLRAALQAVVESVGTATTEVSRGGRAFSEPLSRARSWFMTGFPLLASLVASFDFVEDADACRLAGIRVAAVNEYTREVFINPHAGLTESELRFVVAHEVLHVALRHTARCLGRDAYLWNIACDFVINGWLIEMGVGTLPALGLLNDPQLAELSAEAVYDRIATDMRRYRKLMTLAGDQCDIIGRAPGAGDVDLDEFYRSQLAKGFALHQQMGRGMLPAGLVEEIRALAQPPIPWDVQLARWFDELFPPLEPKRSYARASRRQSASPDIPRPSRVHSPEQRDGRVFGVVVDTSGSMDRELLGKALGAIASFSLARDVTAARVVYCDARAHDAGYRRPEQIAGRIEVRGRGGTVLQPGIDLLENARDFPPAGPVLIITDGRCDRLSVRRQHAYLLPAGGSLPFVPVGPVFRLA